MGSGGITFIIVAVMLGIAVIVGVVTYNKKKNLQEEGKIINRSGNFWESAEFLTTVSSYAEIKSGIKKTDLASCGVTAEYDFNGKAAIFFKCSHGWNGVLQLSGVTTDGKQNVFKLYFPAWRTIKYGFPAGAMEMNQFRTAIEKVFLDYDYDTTVQLRRMELKTKTDFV